MDKLEHIFKNTAFIDVEASGLMDGSFPVEVAWFLNNIAYDKLINPFDHWDVSKWDDDAQAIHGLSLMYLKKHGERPLRLASELNHYLKGKVVVSDAPEFDDKWLDILHNSVNIKREYEVISIGRLLSYLGYNAEQGNEIFEFVRQTNDPSGRAVNGVNFLRSIYAEAIRRKM